MRSECGTRALVVFLGDNAQFVNNILCFRHRCHLYVVFSAHAEGHAFPTYDEAENNGNLEIS